MTDVLDEQATPDDLQLRHPQLPRRTTGRLESRLVQEQLLGRFPELRLAPGYHCAPAPARVMVRRPARLDVVL
ncbi:hypothetical protein [Streptomyces sp. NPDC050121]|uniref:hypothetical protein n=1 Tax=Streptomyces sp. NPDC050121 TaxID=3365601 RepID=UPI0037B7EB4A